MNFAQWRVQGRTQNNTFGDTSISTPKLTSCSRIHQGPLPLLIHPRRIVVVVPSVTGTRTRDVSYDSLSLYSNLIVKIKRKSDPDVFRIQH